MADGTINISRGMIGISTPQDASVQFFAQAGRGVLLRTTPGGAVGSSLAALPSGAKYLAVGGLGLAFIVLGFFVLRK